MPSTERRGFKQIAKALQWSLKGLHATFKHEPSFRLEFYLFIILVPLAIYITQSAMQLLLLIGIMVWLLILEILNSAIEAVVDLACKEQQHVLAGRAKDMGSAAVFLGQLLCVASWGVVLYQVYG